MLLVLMDCLAMLSGSITMLRYWTRCHCLLLGLLIISSNYHFGIKMEIMNVRKPILCYGLLTTGLGVYMLTILTTGSFHLMVLMQGKQSSLFVNSGMLLVPPNAQEQAHAICCFHWYLYFVEASSLLIFYHNLLLYC